MRRRRPARIIGIGSSGGLGDMTIFSLNYHKHIHTGEGGVVTTNDDYYAERLQLIRNHGEAVVGDKGVKNLANTFGFNLRPTEITAAIGTAQLAKLPRLLDRRIENADFLNARLGELPGIRPPVVQPGCKHVYYVQSFLYDEKVVGVPRDRFVDAVAAELPLPEDRQWALIFSGYVDPLYLLPMYQQKVAYGTHGHPIHHRGESRGIWSRALSADGGDQRPIDRHGIHAPALHARRHGRCRRGLYQSLRKPAGDSADRLMTPPSIERVAWPHMMRAARVRFSRSPMNCGGGASTRRRSWPDQP